jgi:hypothetical protein
MKKLLSLITALFLMGSMTVVSAATWTVAGDKTDVFGTAWDPSNTSNDMTLSSGLYRFSKCVNFSANTNIQFKVCKDQGWTTAYPSSNYQLSIPNAGLYNIVITFNESTKAVSAQATRTVYSLATATLPGRSGDWAADGMKLNSEDRIIFKALPAGTYSFKITNGTWDWNKGYNDRDASASNITLSNDGGNLKFVTSATRDVIIAYKASTGKISVNAYESAKVKFFAPRDNTNPWDHVYAYAWDNDGFISAPWPGDEITNNKEEEWYVYSLRKGANLLFHDNSGMQTKDISNVTADVCYYPTSIDYDSSPKKVTVSADGDCKMSYYVAGYKSLVGGNTDWGTNVPLNANNEVVFEDVPAGEYAFKINIGSWAWGIGGNDHLKEGCASIAQTVGIGNVGFSIDHTQDITITYYPVTQEICLGAETTKATGTVSVADMNIYSGKTKTIPVTTNIANYPTPQYEILSGSQFISIENGKISGLAAGEATVRISIAETADYLPASSEFNVTVSDLATAKVRIFAPRNETHPWTQVYAYSWIDDDPMSDPWPGDEITPTKNSGWYEYDVPVGANLLFHDNNGMQTNDILNVTAAASYVSASIDDSVDPQKVTLAAQNSVNYYVAGYKSLVGGETDWETNVPLDANNEVVFPNVPAGQYAFKINIGNWVWSIGGNNHLKEGCANIAQTVGVGNVGFEIDEAQDITITYYPATEEICLGAVTVKAPGQVTASDMNITAGESKKIEYWTNIDDATASDISYTIVSNESGCITLNNNTIYALHAGTATVRVSIAETANYLAASAEFTVTASNAAMPAELVAPIGGKFLINANHDTVVFSRGNLRYDYGAQTWYCSEKQYEVLGVEPNLHFGDPNYTGPVDLFSWSNTNTNYGLIKSYKDVDFQGTAPFVDWGNVFTGETQWSTLSKDEMNYLLAHNKWSLLVLHPDADADDEHIVLALFPYDWQMPAGFDFSYRFYNLDDDDATAAHTFSFSQWDVLEAAGAVLIPTSGSRAGFYGNTWNGSSDTGSEFNHVDLVEWYGYYWLSTMHPTKPNEAYYLILPGFSEGDPSTAEDDAWAAPAVWNREKRRGNAVRLVTRLPRQESVIRDGLNDGKWGTLCPKQNVEFVNGATFYQIAYLEEQNGMPYNMVFDEINGTSLTAGKPYFFIASAEAIKGSKVGEALTAAGPGQNGFYGYIGDASWELPYVADYDPTSDNTYVIYNNAVARINQSNTMIRSERCYINISPSEPTRASVPQNAARRRVTMSVHNTNVATGLDNVQNNNLQCTKVIENGVLYVIKNGTKYNAQGQIIK